MRETEDVYSVVVYTLADQYCCSASSVGRPVRWQTQFASRTASLGLRCVSVKRYIDPVLAEVMIQFQLTPANSVSVPAGQP
jgi:hypothetical protein